MMLTLYINNRVDRLEYRRKVRRKIERNLGKANNKSWRFE